MTPLPAKSGLDAEPMIQAWLEALKHPDAAVRRQAADIWAGVAGALQPAVSLLTAALEDETPAVREAAVRALGSLGLQAAASLPPLRAALKRTSLEDRQASGIRASAAEALSRLGSPPQTPITELIESLESPSAPVRFSACQALAERGADGTPAVGALLKISLRDPDPWVRLEAAIALYKIDGRQEMIIPMLIKALNDPDEVRRWIAADCLREIGPPARDAVPALVEGLRGEFRTPLIRTSFELALNRIDPETAAREGIAPASRD